MQSTSSQLNFKNTNDYFVHQFNTGCLSQYAYYIESNKEAVIIDPMRESAQYIELLSQRGATLKYILETHFHADFVSGHCELAKLTGAKIVFGPKASPEYEAHIAKDGEVLSVGSIQIKVFHTPGHTMESTSYVLLDTDKQPIAIFTGDFLFLGDVGRPDLAVSKDITERDLAGHIYESIQKLKSSFPDEIVVFPGHGAGSACGKNISQGASCTLGRQKKNNYALNDNLTKDEFIEIVTSNLHAPPKYFFLDVMMNKKGYDMVEKVLEKSLNPINTKDFLKLENHAEYAVIDSRDIPVSKKGFFKGSYLIPLKIQYAIWTATLISSDKKIILVTEQGQEKESIIRLARVGYENVVGYVEGGFTSLESYCIGNGLTKKIVSIESVDLTDIKNKLLETNLYIIDSREKSEWQSTGVVSNSHLFSLSTLEENIQEILKESAGRPIGVFCKTGGRATVAASILKKNDVEKVYNLGGILNMIEQKVELNSFTN